MNVFEDFAMKQGFHPGLTLDQYCSTLPATELGNAYRIQIRHGERLRYLPKSGSWIAFDGLAWRRDSNHRAMSIVEKTVLLLSLESRLRRPGEEADENVVRAYKDFLKHATGSQSARAMSSALRLAEAGLIGDDADFDNKPELLNTPSGTVCLKDASVYPNHPDDMLTGLANFPFNSKAPRAVWEQFIADVCKDKRGRRNTAKEAYLKVALGYSLWANNERNLMFFITGDDTDETRNGRNGKSVLFEVISNVLGSDYARRFEGRMICRHNGKAPDATDRLPLIGSRIAFNSELNPSDLLDTSTMKALTGETEIHARSLHKNSLTTRTTATLWLLTNHLPRFSTNEKAVWARVRRIIFENYFWDGEGKEPKGHWQELDVSLSKRLKAESEGILAWLIEGAVEYHKHGLPDFEDATASLDTTRDDHDPVGDFLETCAVRGDGERVRATDLYAAYTRYAQDSGADAESQTAFGRALNAKGINKVKAGTVYRQGIRFSVIGKAYADGRDPIHALKFIAKSADGKTVLHGNEMGDEDLARVPEMAAEGDTFTTADGVLFTIVKAGESHPIDDTNIIKFAGRR